MEGVSEGALPPGVKPAGFKPQGSCESKSDCVEGFECRSSNKNISSCDATTGTDVSNPISTCVMGTCKACEVCYTAMAGLPDMVKSLKQADVVAARWVCR